MVSAGLVLDVVEAGDMHVLGTELLELLVVCKSMIPCCHDRVVCRLHEPEGRLGNGLHLVVCGKRCDPRCTDRHACCKESRIVCHQPHCHESTVGETSLIDALAGDVGVRLDELIDQGLQGLRVDRLVVVGNLTIARVHPIGRA